MAVSSGKNTMTKNPENENAVIGTNDSEQAHAKEMTSPIAQKIIAKTKRAFDRLLRRTIIDNPSMLKKSPGTPTFAIKAFNVPAKAVRHKKNAALRARSSYPSFRDRTIAAKNNGNHGHVPNPAKAEIDTPLQGRKHVDRSAQIKAIRSLPSMDVKNLGSNGIVAARINRI